MVNRISLWLVAAVATIAAGCGSGPPASASRIVSSSQSSLQPVPLETLDERFDQTDRRVRAEFRVSLSQIEHRMSRGQVAEILGKPDQVVFFRAQPGVTPDNGYEEWRYGSSSPDSMPVLGRVHFKDGGVQVTLGAHEEPPLESVISERELRSVLRYIYATAPDAGNDALHLIRVVNRLQRLGKPKAVAVLKEYARLDGFHGEWLFWVPRVLFEVPNPPGYMRTARIGAYGQEAQQETRIPRFPIILMDDIPFSLFAGASLAGLGEPFSSYLDEFAELKMRENPLRPPDNPFLSYWRVLESSEWPHPPGDPNDTRFRIPYLEEEGKMLKEVLVLVRTAYSPEWMHAISLGIHQLYVNGLDYERCHKEFLELDVRWDEARQMYVRRFGTTLEGEPRAARFRHWDSE